MTSVAESTAPEVPALNDLPARVLTRQELRELVSAIADDPAAWQPHVAYDDEHRHYVCLHRDANVDVWVLCWTPSNDTGWHDHDISSGAVAVAHGEVIEHNLVIGSAALEIKVPAGQSFHFGPDHIHRMTGAAEGSVSIHAYSPPLWRMGQYAISTTGVLRRTSVSYADELRPVDEPFPDDQERLRDAVLGS
ncbi:cysteine dioxygenase family protein [Kineosporia sp. J2-2]|uniref:Cysteine dioxygenase family protein n=1 Tax=Kineosporia corallincola TaxID=2835133 RepID=A0ABS5TAD2_9ACTN|nr:cysteine dioxygenase family protein [Kineosporia corallincola]MBT0767414.1 cysteine dioxygenase family protein [Kineosporia corallincola]